MISHLTNELISALISERYSLADSNSFFRLQNKRSNRCFSILIEKEIITSPYFYSVETTIEMNSFFPNLYSNMNRSSTRWTPRHMLRLLKLQKKSWWVRSQLILKYPLVDTLSVVVCCSYQICNIAGFEKYPYYQHVLSIDPLEKWSNETDFEQVSTASITRITYNHCYTTSPPELLSHVFPLLKATIEISPWGVEGGGAVLIQYSDLLSFWALKRQNLLAV